MASGNQRALNTIWSGLQGTLPKQTNDPYDLFQQQNQRLASNIGGLQRPASFTEAGDKFDTGVEDYSQKAGLAGTTAQALLGQATDLFNRPGYSAGEKQGMRTATTAGFAAPYAAAANEAKLRGLRTGNTAGVDANLMAGARERGRMIAGGLGGLEQEFGQARIQGEQFGTGAQQEAAKLGQQAIALNQFPQLARLQRMKQEADVVGMGAIPAQQQLSAYGQGLQGQLGLSGQRSQFQVAQPSFMRTLGQGLAGSLGKVTGKFGGSGVGG